MATATSKMIMEKYPNKKKFIFYVVTENGDTLLWQNLREDSAARMNVITKNHPPTNILKFGIARQPNPEEVKKNDNSTD